MRISEIAEKLIESNISNFVSTGSPSDSSAQGSGQEGKKFVHSQEYIKQLEKVREGQ